MRVGTHLNEYGGAIGGPVVIPRLYNGHDRTFFFFLFGGSRKDGLDNSQSLVVPTQAEIGGNFSALTTPIYDPATTTLQPNGTYTRTAFPGNVIPASRIDPVAAAIAKYYPAPNQSGAANYATFSGALYLYPTIFVAKVDHQIAADHRISVSVIRTRNPRFNVVNNLPEPLLTVGNQIDGGWTARTNYNWTVAPNKLNSLAIGYNRFINIEPPPVPNTNWPQQIGLTGINSNTMPYIDFLTNGFTYLASYRNLNDTENDFLGQETFFWTIGKHTLQFGAEGRRVQFNDVTATPATSQFNFSSLETAQPGVGSTGNSFASFLLGASDAAFLTEPFVHSTRYSYAGLFVQDDYRVTSRLTLNLGLRWEFQTPPVEAFNHSSMISLTTPNPGAGNLPGALVFAGSGPGLAGSRAFVRDDYSGLGPRFGVSFLPRPRTVLRGGYGIYYADTGQTLVTTGFQAQGQANSPNNGATPALYLRNGFPSGVVVAPTRSPTLINGQSGTYVGPNGGAMPRIQEWTAGIQQAFGNNWSLEISYVGNHATRLINPQMVNINQVNPQYLSLGNLLTAPAASAAAQAAGIKLPYAGFTGSVAQVLRPYPQYLTLTSQAAKAGASMWNGMEVVLTKRFGSGFSFGGNYTFAKALGYGSSTLYDASTNNVLQNSYNPHAEWSLLPIDVRNTVILQYIYDLPVGNGRRWLNQSGIADVVLGGWRLSAIQRYQSGFPLEIAQSNTLPTFNYVMRPNRVLGVNLGNHIPVGKFNPTSDHVINATAFSLPASFTFGDASPAYDGLTQYSVLDEDMSLMKSFRIKERLTWTTYGQFFNVFNRHYFTGVDSNFTDSTFGQTTGVSEPREVQLGMRVAF